MDLTAIASVVAAVLGVVSVGLHFVHLLKLDGVAANMLDNAADGAVKKAAATPDPKDDGIAAAEAAVLHSIAGLIRDGKVDQGVSALQAWASGKAGK